MTEPYLMPDSERIVLEALRTVLPGVRCAVYLPTDWQLALRETGGLVIARRVGGTMKDKRYVDEGMFVVQTYAAARADASLLARRARAGLVRLTFEQWGNTDGYLSRFREATGPFMTTDPMTEAQTDSYRFSANYMIATRPR
ncbi:hypothetical protein [Streptomyces sp. FH025]|uniref:phage tail termination protein n=1 Tax=Streptomyces sp. FH025 TaxID=2815937 RepID=UPI001A9EE3E1|nr:hypothetical protein [Streptomyces sp. FH025]MBO1414462.1 hypothetical protein [Streptomyces sp. FH025]